MTRAVLDIYNLDMSINLNTGLSDMSRALGESNVNTSTGRIGHYNDAVIDFFSEKKYPFALKTNSSLTTAIGTQSYSLATITDLRRPGGIKEITLGNSDEPLLPISWELRNSPQATSRNFYTDPDDQTLYFVGDITEVKTINIYHYLIPARIEDTNSGSTFPIPEKYRRAVALLAAAYVQYSRYLSAEGDTKMRLYVRELQRVGDQQSERHTGNARYFGNYLAAVGFRRRYK